MEVIVFFALLLVIATKGYTTHSAHALEARVRAAQSEEAEVSERLQTTETTLRALEKEHKALEQEIKHLENDKDLATLDVAKSGGKPLTEDQLEQLIQASSKPRPTSSQSPPKKQEAEPDEPQSAASEAPVEEQGAPTQKEQPANAPAKPSQPASPNASSDKTKEAETSSTRPRILVVDDNDELRALLLQALAKEYEVLEAPDGFEALSQILKQKEQYDLIITDLNMPKVNGITLVEHLPENMPTIVISAFLNKPEFKKALAKLQPAYVLEKPFQIATLRTAIQDILTSQN